MARRRHCYLFSTNNIALALLLLALVLFSNNVLRSLPGIARHWSSLSRKDCLFSRGSYRGSLYQPSETLENVCLVESPWMRLARHAIRFPDTVVIDWLWIDYHDRVNVLVEAPHSGDSPREMSYLILKQNKYALEDPSLAVVGGIIEPGEEATFAAKREVHEELGVNCKIWKALGRFRTDVNRGMGWVNPFLARDCIYTSDSQNYDSDTENSNQVGGSDAEEQHLQVMPFSEVRDSAVSGKFVEVQWSNTVALAILHISSEVAE